MRILIAGCGYVGTELVKVLSADGHHVWGLRRNGVVLPKGAESVQADVTKPETLGMLPAGLDAVVYAISAGGYDAARYRAAYVDGFKNLVTALESRSQPVKRVVYVSSTGVYAQDDGEWVDESSPAEQAHFSGALLLEGERLAREGHYPATVLRLGGIYGPGRTRLIDSVREGTARLPAKPAFINLIHRDDCVGIIRHVLSMQRPEPLYLGVDSNPVDRRELLTWVAERLQLPAPSIEDVPTTQRSLRGNKRCSNARIVSAGYKFFYSSFAEGYRDLI